MTLAVRRVSDDVCVDLGLEVVAWAAQSERPFFSRPGAIFKRAEGCDIFNQVWSHRFGDRFKRSSLPVILAVFSCLQIRGAEQIHAGEDAPEGSTGRKFIISTTVVETEAKTMVRGRTRNRTGVAGMFCENQNPK